MTGRRAWRYDRRPRWRKDILSSPHYSPTHKLILAATAERMRADGKFAVERKEVMWMSGVKHPQRVTEAWSRAVLFEHLTLVTKMAYGQPTRYQAIFPTNPCGELCTRDEHKFNPRVVTANPVTISTHAAPAQPPTWPPPTETEPDLEDQRQWKRELPSLIRLAADRFAMPDNDERTGT